VVQIPHKAIEPGIAGEFRRTSAAPALSLFAALSFALCLGLGRIMPHKFAAGIENVERDLIVLRSVGRHLRLLFRARLSCSASGLSGFEFRILWLLTRSRRCSLLLRLLAFDCGLQLVVDQRAVRRILSDGRSTAQTGYSTAAEEAISS